MNLPQGLDTTGAYLGVPLEDAWFIEDTLVYSGPRLYLWGSFGPAISEWNTAFFDITSGEVYAKRICTNYSLPWNYTRGNYPWIFKDHEDYYRLPPGVFEYYLAHLTELINGNFSRYPNALNGTPPYGDPSWIESPPDGGYRCR